eukprot:1147191-Prorocentrum_minimum.AAC.1
MAVLPGKTGNGVDRVVRVSTLTTASVAVMVTVVVPAGLDEVYVVEGLDVTSIVAPFCVANTVIKLLVGTLTGSVAAPSFTCVMRFGNNEITRVGAAVGAEVVGDKVVGDNVGATVVGDLVGDRVVPKVVGDAVVGDAVVGDAVVGDA